MPLWILCSLFGLCNIAVMWVVTLVFRRLRWSPKQQRWVILPGIIFCSYLQASLERLGAQTMGVRFWGGMTWAFILLLIASRNQRYDLRLFKD